MMQRFQRVLLLPFVVVVPLLATTANAEVKTWDGRHSIEQVEVTMVYFVPKDRMPLPDWRERIGYFAERIERFHQREYDGQSTLTAVVQEQPFVSERTTEELRQGDGDAIFFKTLREIDRRLSFARENEDAFPILLVMSDINWRPLDDFFRLQPTEKGPAFEGQLIDGYHHPGATSGGARATYLADRGCGWGLVSADGWRVPYRGTDCVVYHEGVGHTVGLPHPEPGNGSVMSLGQYRGWINESWLDESQKRRLGWTTPEKRFDREKDLFSEFRALPEPKIPSPGDEVSLTFDWPSEAKVESCRVLLQTQLWGPWREVPTKIDDDKLTSVSLGSFDRATPVSYRVDAETADGETVELWGYLQVRAEPNQNPQAPESLLDWYGHAIDPAGGSPGNITTTETDSSRERDLLAPLDVNRGSVSGSWTLQDGRLESPKAYGARIELPGDVPEAYQLTVIAEPLDEPNGLILGQLLDGNRFLVLLNYGNGQSASSALENVDGRNVGNNETTREGVLFKKGRPSQIICTVRKNHVQVVVDGHEVINWRGEASQLSLGDYWKTPKSSLFLGAYDCRYRFLRVGLTPLQDETESASTEEP